MLVVMRAGDLSGVAGADFLAADDDGDVNHEVALTLQFFLEGYSLGRASQVSLDRLIGRQRECDYRIVHISVYVK